jgi:hypothetical protein
MRPNQNESKSTITPLSSENYYTWVNDILPELRVHEVCGFALEDLVAKINASEMSDLQKAEKLAKDQCALGLIQTHCTSTYKGMISRCKTAKEAWDKLEAHFMKKYLSSQTELHKAINAIQFSWSEGLDKYVQKHCEARQRFEDAGVENSEAFYLSVFLSNLPEEFETSIDILESQENTTTIDHTLGKLNEKYRKLTKKRKFKPDQDQISSKASDDDDRQSNSGSTQNISHHSLLAEMAESLKLLSARLDKHDDKDSTKAKKRKTANGICSSCGGPNSHDLSRCWANPESVYYRPNWDKSIAAAARRKNTQEQHDSSDESASALVGKLLGKNFGKS